MPSEKNEHIKRAWELIDEGLYFQTIFTLQPYATEKSEEQKLIDLLQEALIARYPKPSVFVSALRVLGRGASRILAVYLVIAKFLADYPWIGKLITPKSDIEKTFESVEQQSKQELKRLGKIPCPKCGAILTFSFYMEGVTGYKCVRCKSKFKIPYQSAPWQTSELIVLLQATDSSISKSALEQLRPTGTLVNGNLQDIQMLGLKLEEANLDEVDMRNSKLDESVFRSTSFKNAKLQNCSLKGVDLSNADLTGASLESTNLQEANLEKANLTGANLRNANLEGANLRHANLSFCDLIEAVLPDATKWNTDIDMKRFTDAQD